MYISYTNTHHSIPISHALHTTQHTIQLAYPPTTYPHLIISTTITSLFSFLSTPPPLLTFFFFFLNNPAPPEISPFPLPAPLPINSARQQRAAYPDIAPRMLPMPPREAFVRALAAAEAMGWEVVGRDSGAGTIEAVDTTRWFG